MKLSHRLWRTGVAACLLAAALAVGVYLRYGAESAANVGFPLDDSWIHAQIARNVATGQGWSFNPGEPTAAATAPLWVMLITPLFWLPGDPTVWIKVLGSLLLLSATYLTLNLARDALGDDRSALLAGFLTATQPALVYSALSGMETALFVTLILLAVRSAARARTIPSQAYLATAWLMLAGWARPEVWALLPLFWVYVWLQRRGLPATRWGWHLGLAALGIAGFVLFHMALWGNPLPTTYYAKSAAVHGGGAPGLLRWLWTLADHFLYNLAEAAYSQNPLLLMGLGLALVRLDKRPADQRAFLVFWLALVVGVSLLTALTNLGSIGFHTFRRTAHILPGLTIVVATGVLALWDEIAAVLPPMRCRLRWAALGVVLLALAIQVNHLRYTGSLFSNDLRSINEGDVAAAHWIAEQTPSTALIAANDIGAMAYVGQRRIFDLIGLASPEVIPTLAQTGRLAPTRSQRLKEWLLARQVDYVVIFPSWFPTLAQDPDLVPVQRFRIERPTALAGDEVVVYRLSRGR